MRMAMIATAALLVTACGGAAGGDGNGPVRRQPGSWSTKIEITKLDAGAGVDTNRIREGMQAAMNAASGTSICVTPEAAARESAADIEKMAAGRDCQFERKAQVGEKIDFAGICKDARGQRVRIALSGTSGATAQDLTMAMSPVETGAAGLKAMEMRVRTTRTGDCKPGDITPPTPGNVAG